MGYSAGVAAGAGVLAELLAAATGFALTAGMALAVAAGMVSVAGGKAGLASGSFWQLAASAIMPKLQLNRK